MSDKLGTKQFQDEVMKLVSRYANESDITVAEMIGTLEVCKINILDTIPVSQAEDN